MDTISDYLVFSQILDSGPMNASLYITGLSLSNNNILFTYHECSNEFCLTCAVQLRTYLKIQQSWQVALSFHSLFCKKLFSSKHTVLNNKHFCFGVVIEEYQTFWDNLNKVAHIWFEILSMSKSFTYVSYTQILRKDNMILVSHTMSNIVSFQQIWWCSFWCKSRSH